MGRRVPEGAPLFSDHRLENGAPMRSTTVALTRYKLLEIERRPMYFASQGRLANLEEMWSHVRSTASEMGLVHLALQRPHGHVMRFSATNCWSAASLSHTERSRSAFGRHVPAKSSRARQAYVVTGRRSATCRRRTRPNRGSVSTEERSTRQDIPCVGSGWRKVTHGFVGIVSPWRSTRSGAVGAPFQSHVTQQYHGNFLTLLLLITRIVRRINIRGSPQGPTHMPLSVWCGHAGTQV